MTVSCANPWTRMAGTGHRELIDGDPDWVAEQLPKAAVWLRDTAGTRVGISGLALGFDLDWAEAILEAGLTLWVAIPFEQQAARWKAADQARWNRIRAAATRERVIGHIAADLEPRYRSAAVNRLLFKRNTTMLDFGQAVLTVWEPGRLDGGTAGALLEAAKRQIPGVHLDPVTRRVNFHLPARADLERFALYNTSCGHIAYVGVRAETLMRLAALTAARCPAWQIRKAKPRESWHDGCPDCLVDLAAAASNRVHVPA